jgi:hypothetical protein
MTRRMLLSAGLLLAAAALALPAGAGSRSRVGPPPKELVQALGLSPFYRQHLSAGGLPVLASGRVSPFALREAAYLVDGMLAGRDDLRRAVAGAGIRVVVMAPDEMTTAVPEHSDLKPSLFWDRRARGLGATRARPAVSCGEENLLGYPGDPYAGENILIHEFAHVIHHIGLREAEPEFDRKLRETYRRATAAGRWKGTYAAVNASEYWAEGVQSWFDCNQAPNHSHNGVRTREQLLEHDPDLHALIDSVFPEKEWRYRRPAERAEMGHLRGYRPSRAPRFRWDPALDEWYRKHEERRRRHEALLRGGGDG